jgi:hypothetical protein
VAEKSSATNAEGHGFSALRAVQVAKRLLLMPWMNIMLDISGAGDVCGGGGDLLCCYVRGAWGDDLECVGGVGSGDFDRAESEAERDHRRRLSYPTGRSMSE